MVFDIITVSPTTDSVAKGAHGAGDVMFNLTAFNLPARACKLVNIFMEVANGGGEDDTKIGLLFFKKNTTATLGTLNETANIAHADFTANQYIGSAFMGLTDADSRDLDVIDTTALYYGMTVSQYANNARGGSGTDNMVLMTDKSGDNLFTNTMYVGGVVHSGAPDFDADNNVKIHLHIEY